MKYRQKRQQDYHTPPYIKSINQNIDGNYKPHPRVYLQNASNKPLKFHDDNQNNTQYVRIIIHTTGMWLLTHTFAEFYDLY